MVSYPTSSRQVRYTAALATVPAVVLLAACGNSTPANTTSSSASSGAQASASSSSTPAPPPGPPAPPPPPKVRAQGTVNSITGSTVALGAKKGPTTVAITATTKVIQANPAQLTDVSTGSCVAVSLTPVAPGAPPAPAKSITVSPAANGKCTQATTDKSASGTVTAVNGQTVSVAASAAPPITVPVDNKTRYTKQDSASALAIAQGTCLSADGTVDPGGVLQATKATVSPAAKGPCPGS